MAGLPERMLLYSLNGEKVCLIVVPANVRQNHTYTRLLSPTDDIKIDYAEPLGST